MILCSTISYSIPEDWVSLGRHKLWRKRFYDITKNFCTASRRWAPRRVTSNNYQLAVFGSGWYCREAIQKPAFFLTGVEILAGLANSELGTREHSRLA